MEPIPVQIGLNEVEQKLRRMYLRHPGWESRRPCNEEEVRDILFLAFPNGMSGNERDKAGQAEHLDTMIQEHAFIPPDMDISFVRHMRYMPAFWHRHTFFELLCVLRGTCHNIFHDKVVAMAEGDICIHSPGTVHAVSAFSDDAILLNILIRKSTFEQAFFGMLRGNSILAGFFRRSFYRTSEMPYLMFHTQGDTILPRLILEAKSEAESDHRYRRSMVNVLITQMLIRMLENHEHRIELPEFNLNGKNTNLMEILDYVNRNYAAITLKELSEHFNYSERQMQRIITDATGMPFSKSIQMQKMQRAAALLSESELSVAAICEQIGYPSQNNFRKVFLRYYGVTPSVFRSSHKKDSESLSV